MQVRIRTYEDDLYYPFYVNHRFVEVRGRDIKASIRNEPVVLTKHQFDDIMHRLSQLEEMTKK